MEVSKKFLRLARRLNEPIICDIGSRDATEGLYLLDQLDGRILHIFEPNPEALVRCRENIVDRENVVMNELGLSDASGEVDFFPIDLQTSEQKDIGFSSMYKFNPEYTKGRRRAKQTPIKIRVTTLDEYFDGKDKPDILWIDVEGAELDVLKGAANVLKHVSLIHLEAGFRPMHIGRPLFAEIDKLLTTNGFRLYGFKEFPKILGQLYLARLLPNPPWRCNAIYVVEPASRTEID